MIYTITGASAVGKSTLVNHLKTILPQSQFDYYHFDSIGIPDFEEMIAEYGSTEKWQEVKTEEWMERLIQAHEESGKNIIFEGSTSIAFIKKAFEKRSFQQFQIILIDCDFDTMTKRLIEERNQPELVNEHMENWLLYLRKQANQSKIPILKGDDVDDLSKQFIEILNIA